MDKNTVGNIIWQQIPVMTKMACGMRDAHLIPKGLCVTVGRAQTRLEITLNGGDLYDCRLIHIGRAPKRAVTVVEEHTDIFCEDLGEILYHMVNK